MSCCTPGTMCGNGKCPCNYVHWFPRIAFGLVLASYGVNHYRHMNDFAAMSKSAFPAVPVLAGLVGILAYIVPALMIVGGVLFAVRQFGCVAKTCILLSLCGIIGWAALAVMTGDGASGGSYMPAIQNAVVLLVWYYVIKKSSCCSSSCAPMPGMAGGK